MCCFMYRSIAKPQLVVAFISEQLCGFKKSKTPFLHGQPNLRSGILGQQTEQVLWSSIGTTINIVILARDDRSQSSFPMDNEEGCIKELRE